MIVIDASALVDVLLGRPGADRALDRIEKEAALHAPHLLDTETVHTLRRWVVAGKLEAANGTAALADLADLPLVYYPHPPLRRRVWELRDRLSAYDATYVALAEALEATLLTADRRLARAAEPLVTTVTSS